jgi:hypothetical protein
MSLRGALLLILRLFMYLLGVGVSLYNIYSLIIRTSRGGMCGHTLLVHAQVATLVVTWKPRF